MLIDTKEDFRTYLDLLTLQPEVAIDTETTGLWPFKGDELIGVSVYTPETGAAYFPFRHAVGRNLPVRELRQLRKVVDPKRQIGFNYKFDLEFLALEGWTPTESDIEDVMLAAHLMNENEPQGFHLKGLSDKYLGSNSSEEEKELTALLRERGLGKGDMRHLEPGLVAPYAAKDAELTFRLRDFYLPHLREWELYDLWQEVNRYMLLTLKMETFGVKVDTRLIRRQMKEAVGHLATAQAELEKLAGYPINANSPKQVQAFMGMTSCTADILERIMENGHPKAEAAQAILHCRGWAKLVGSYHEPYLQLIDDEDVLHPSFKLHGTVSGRLSCTNPNLQAVAKTNDVFKVRDLFIARPGYTLVSADYNQAEMRLASHYAHEENMAALLRAGADIHSATADKLGIPRDAAKRINFGVIYGLGARGLSETLHISQAQAAEYLRLYHQEYPGFRVLYRKAETTGENRGYIRLFTGRVRRYNSTTSPSHKAMSNLIQGGVAEMMRLALQRLDRELADTGARILLQIHDDIIFEVPKDELKAVLPRIKGVMEDQPFSVPMPVDVKYGHRWGKMRKWKVGVKRGKR